MKNQIRDMKKEIDKINRQLSIEQSKPYNEQDGNKIEKLMYDLISISNIYKEYT
jgi:hypothetical protein